MPTSGLVIRLAGDDRLRNRARAAISSEPMIECGDETDRRLPVSLTAETVEQSRRVQSWLTELPGVEHVDVVFVSVDPPAPENAAGPSRGAVRHSKKGRKRR